MNRITKLDVFINEEKVGTLAETQDHRIAFAYDSEWLSSGFSISPISLPLEAKVFIPKNYDPFDGLFGVFSDSLPDGWGRLLVDRMLLKMGEKPEDFGALNRLAIVGNTGMGALTYCPSQEMNIELQGLNLDELATECRKLFDTDSSQSLDELFRLGGSSGGARPKVFYSIDGEEWIVKFPSSMDRANIGEEEYEYSLCAQKCGIIMPETKLLPSRFYKGYFAIKRFDRKRGQRIHMISAGGLLETSHRIPNLDYDILMQLTMILTRDYVEIEKLFRLMCFNVFAHNRDDHSKNFSFIYNGKSWELSPAYDLTYSNSIGGQHATTVHGNGENPGKTELLAVAEQIEFDMNKAREIVEEVETTVHEMLFAYLK